MRDLPIFLAACMIGTSLGAETPADRFQPKRGLNTDTWVEWLSVEDLATRPGFLDVYPDWRRHVAPERVAELGTLGFDFVRLSADPSPLLRLGPGPAQDAAIDQLRATTDALQAAGLKVIVDLHSIPRGTDPWGTEAIVGNPDLFQAHVALVGRVAARMADLDPDRTAIEVLNEPTHDCDGVYGGADMVWPDQLRQLHAAARNAAPKLPIVLTGACWGGAESLAVLDPALIGDDNVIWSFHSYDPFLFTHQGASWTSWANAYFGGLPYPPSLLDDAGAEAALQSAKARLAARPIEGVTEATLSDVLAEYRETPLAEMIGKEIEIAAAWADRHGIPRSRIILGEFGAIRDGEPGPSPALADRARFLADKRARAEAAGIGWAVWSWGGSMGLVSDDSTRSMPQDICDALGLLACPS
jgi:hypothetical protein